MPHIVNLACGLANRMFQYSYFLYLKDKGYRVEVDAYDSGTLAHERVEWERIFPNATFLQANRANVWLMGGAFDVISRARRKFLPFTTSVLQMPAAFDVVLPDKYSKSKYIIGVFQNAAMVESVASKVKKAFAFAHFEDDYNIGIAEKTASCNSVAIHVRKGKDYQSRIWYKNTCPIEYYQKAVEEIRKKVDNPKFFVFCDNKQWVRDNFRWLDYTLVDGNPGVGYGCHFDIQQMSCCKHNIISNSTYSWWGAYLNSHDDKIVILPKVWFNPSSCEGYTSEPLTCRGWIQI